MKTTLKLHFFLLLAVLSLSGFAHAQGTAVGYQGRLNDGARPATGLYDFNFKVFDVEAGGGALAGTVVRNAVPVTNGVFSVSLDFGAGVFAGAARWLEISVRTNGVGALSILSPRTSLLPTPYSIFAGSAGNVANGAVTASQLSTVGPAPAPGQFLSYNGGSLAWSDPGVAAGNIWTRNGTAAYYNAGNVGIGTLAPSAYGHGGTARLLEINNNGTTLHSQAHLMLYSGVNSIADSAMGSVTWAQPGGMAAYIGAQTRSTTPNAPSATLTFGTRQAGDGGPSPRMVITEAGNVGIGALVPTAGYRLEVVGATILRPGNGTVQFGSPNAELGMSITPALGNRADLRFDGTTFKLLAGTGLGPPSVVNGVTINASSGNVGIGGSLTPVAKLEVVGQDALRLIGYQPFMSFYDSDNNSYAKARIQSAGGNLFLKPDGGHVTAEATDLWLGHPARRGAPGRALVDIGSELHLNFASDWTRTVIGGNNVSVCSLTIRGGCDLAEPFPMKEEQIDKGSVVVIDQESSGRLRLSTHAYDRRVAGIVSGANGINPGIALTQEGVLDQGQNVALTGRVYVKADASFGEIEPGDLLTTSDAPGHAMKVSDHTRSQGAILGKAMSTLKNGQGLVLVLVTLQ